MQKKIFMCFIDYSKAFDYLDRDLLWRNLQELGIPRHLIELMKNLYTHQEATMRTEFGNTSWFKIGKGVRQGCILSSYLFNLYTESIMRKAGIETIQGIKIERRMINNWRYADDTTLTTGHVDNLRIFFYLPYLSSIPEKANCIAIFCTGRPHSLGSCHFRGVWATCLRHKGGTSRQVPCPRAQQANLPSCSATSPKSRAPSREATDTIF